MSTPPSFIRHATRHAFAILALGALIAPSPARAAISADAQKVVDRYLQATGGAAALAAEHTTHARFTLRAFGLQGAVESWSRLPSSGASVTTIGPFTLREGDDGQTAWRIDQNGRYAELGGTDLEQVRASTWYENEMWARPGQGGGDVTRVGADHDSLGSYTVLEAKAPNGHPRRLWFDDHTGLLVRSVQRDDTRDITDVLGDYRRIGARLRPARTVIRIANMPLNDATMTLDTLTVNETLPDTLFASRESSSEGVHFHGGERHATIPFEYAARHVWLKVSVNGGPFADFLLDTGASITVLDSAFAAAHGITVQGRVQVAGAGSDQGGASFAEIRSLFVPGPDGEGVELGAEKVAVLSLAPHLEPFFWRPVAGVLGYDFISRFAMTLDYDAATVTLADPASFQTPAGATSLPFELASNIPVIEARLDSSLSGRFRLDVGSGSTVDLHGPFVRAHDLENRTGNKLTALGGGFGGTFSGDITRMKRMDLGPFGWDDPIVILSGATEGGLASEDYAGNIGNQVLERFQVTFDYTHKTVWLKPGSRYTKRDEFSLAGLQLARFDGAVRAMNVLARSPAERAGLREGDEVVAVDGRAIKDWTFDALDAMFEHGVPGSQHKIEYRRDGRKKNAKLTLERII
jgi:PDZ domain/Aspartyl protease